MNIRTFACASMVALLTVANTASATLTTYTNEANWIAALPGAAIIVEDFEGFSADETLQANSTMTSPNSFSVTHIGDTGATGIWIDTPVFDGSNNGTNALRGFVASTDSFRIDLDSAVTEFSFDSSLANGGPGARVEIFNSSSVSIGSIALTNGINDFFGFIASGGDDIASLLFLVDRSGGEAFVLDNFQTSSTDVPEPFSAGLVGLGLLGMAGMRKKSTK